jgi:hypothetical protein
VSKWKVDKNLLKISVEHMKGFFEHVEHPGSLEDNFSGETKETIERLYKIDDFLKEMGATKDAAEPWEKVIQDAIEYGAALIVATMMTHGKFSVWIYGGEDWERGDCANIRHDIPTELFPDGSESWGYPKLIDVIREWVGDESKTEKLSHLKNIISQLESES